ncbi:MAG: InlB B-repeat-containing protein [Clostridiales Family XIII bacterium]|jgi:uncharacterized repeat protein (TIGR02543 family)|nr:InlB B-repeat-containing protein [Clostridiales Family XIII bacterium]
MGGGYSVDPSVNDEVTKTVEVAIPENQTETNLPEDALPNEQWIAGHTPLGHIARNDSEGTGANVGSEPESTQGEIGSLSQGDSDDSLTLKVSTPEFVDVDDSGINNAITWPLTFGQKQIEITAKFSGQGSDKERKVEIIIPKGYKITEYTAKETTADIDGVGKLGLSAQDDAMIASADLTAFDGSAWASQLITGYNKPYYNTEESYRNYDGKVVYTFNSNVTQVAMVLTLELDEMLLPHNATTASMNDITVTMKSGDKNFSDHLSTTVTGIPVTPFTGDTLSLAGTVNTEDATKGTIAAFSTVFKLGHGAVGRHFSDHSVMTITYPEGVTYKGFYIDGFNHPTDTTSATYGSHLSVVHDASNRTITFTMDKTTIAADTQFRLYWDGVTIDNSQFKWGQGIVFNGTYVETSGTLGGDPQVHPLRNTSYTVTPSTPNVKLGIWGLLNNARRDLNENGDYPYDYALGQFYIENWGSIAAPNAVYEYTFSPNLAIRAISIPYSTNNGLANNNRIKDLVAHTNKGRTITKSGTSTLPVGAINSGLGASMIRAEFLGLAADEYLLDMTFTQPQLGPGRYNNTYVSMGGFFYGRFQNGKSGPVTLTITDALGNTYTSTGTPVIRWDNVRAGDTTTVASHSESSTTENGTFFPDDTMYFTSVYNATDRYVGTSQDIKDPDVYISLPEGLDLDVDSIRVVSKAGNHVDTPFKLQLKGSETKLVNSVPWTTYHLAVYNPNDIIANASSNMAGNGFVSNVFTLKFSANVSSAVAKYPELFAKDIVLYDLGKSATADGGGTSVADANNWAGKGTAYKLAAATSSQNIAVLQKQGLTISLGIRTVGDTGPYYTYNGTAATVAPVTPDANAEIWLQYENTSTGSYYEGSEIYLSIPKEGINYDHYFNNKEITNPSGNVVVSEPQWTGNLTGPISLDGFDTYYSTSTSSTTNYGGNVDKDWVPYDGPWVDASAIEGLVDTYENVTMVKFVANRQIAKVGESGSKGFTTFEMAVDNNAPMGEPNYWRSYQKGWQQADGDSSVWTFGSILAAEPATAGVIGNVFNDLDVDGIKDAGESFTGLSGVSATLAGDTISLLNIDVEDNGDFASLTSGGTPYYLKAGDYTLTIYNDDVQRGFTPNTPSDRSSGSSPDYDWHMDILQSNISTSHASATYEFTVGSSSPQTQLAGVGLKAASEVTYKAGTGATFPQTSEYKNYNQQPSPTIAPIFQGVNTITGYNPATVVWTANKAVTLNDGSNTVINAGTPMNRTQLLQAKITEAVTFTASLSQYSYTVWYLPDGGTFDGSVTNPVPFVHWGDTVFLPSATQITKPGYDFKGWKLTNRGDTDFDGNVYTSELNPTYSTLAGADTVGSVTLTAQWEAKDVEISYHYLGETLYTDQNDDSLLATKEESAEYDATITGAPDIEPTRTGYTFDGWHVNSPAGTEWEFGAANIGTVLNIANGVQGANGDPTLSLYAKWIPHKYTVAFDGNGKTAGTMTSALNVEHSKSYKIPANVFEKVGYHFNGWLATYTDGGASYGTGNYANKATITSVEDNITLVAQWKIDNYSVTYKANGGTGSVPTDSKVDYHHGDKVSVLFTPLPTKSHRVFTGWATKANATTPNYKVDGTKEFTITDNTTLYAVYGLDSHTVTYDGNAHTSGEAPKAETYIHGGKATVAGVNTLARDGHEFLGWSKSATATSATYTGGESLTITENVNLYAVWKQNEVIVEPPQPDTYTVSYVSGGTGVTGLPSGTSDLLEGASYTVSSQVPARTGWEFVSWNGSNGRTYQSGAALTMPAGDLTLTAQWDEVIAETPEPETNPPVNPSAGNSPNANVSETPTNTATAFEGFNAVTQQKLESQTGNLFSDLANGNVPLGNFLGKGAWSLLSLIMSMAAIIISILMVVWQIAKRRFEDNDIERYAGTEVVRKERNAFIARVLTIVFGILTPITFFVFDDLSLPMVWINKWTLFVGIVFIAHIVTFIVYKLRNKVDDDNEKIDYSGAMAN